MQQMRAVKTELFASALNQTNTATTTANFDTIGGDHADILVGFAAELNTNGVGPTISLLSSDDTVVTNFATITADLAAVTLVSQKLVRYSIDLKSAKRFLRLSVTTATATNDNVSFSAIGILSRLEQSPANTTDEGADVHVVV